MDEYIARASAISTVDNLSRRCEGDYEALVDCLKQAFEELPPSDVQPVRPGKWIPKFNGQFKGGAYWFDCSVCGRTVPDVRNGGWNFCPNCGARMDGDQVETASE